MQITINLPDRFVAGDTDLGPIAIEIQRLIQAAVIRASTSSELGQSFQRAEGIVFASLGRSAVIWHFGDRPADPDEVDEAMKACGNVVKRVLNDILVRSMPRFRETDDERSAAMAAYVDRILDVANDKGDIR